MKDLSTEKCPDPAERGSGPKPGPTTPSASAAHPVGTAVLLALTLAAVLTLPYAALQYQRADLVFFESDTAVETGVKNPRAQVFLDTGTGYSEGMSAATYVRPDGDFHLLRLPIAGRPIHGLRFDPLNGSGTIQIKQPRLVNGYGEVLHVFDLDRAEPVRHIGRQTLVNDTLVLRTVQGATDPGILWTVPDSVGPLIGRTAWRRALLAASKAFALCFACTFTAVFLAGYRGFPKTGRWNPGGAYPRPAEGFFRSRRSTLVLAVALFAALLLVRSWDNLRSPGLYVEDATHYFNLYYSGQRHLSDIFQHPLGYYNILNNVVAWGVSKMDVRLQPAAYRAVAVVLASACASLWLFSGLFRTRWVLAVVPTVLGLAGLNHIFYFTTLSYQHYTTVLLLLCILFLPAPKSTTGTLLVYGACLLLTWSGPYSVAALPAALLFLLFFHEPRKNRQMIWVVICTLTYTLSAEGIARMGNLFEPAIMKRMSEILMEKVLFLDLLGGPTVLKIAVFGGVAAAVIHRLRKVPDYLPMTVLLLAIVAASLAPLFLSVKFHYYDHPRNGHLVVSQFFWLVFVLFTLDTFLRSVPHGAAVPYAATAGMLLLVLVDNYRHPEKGRVAPMEDARAFLEAIHRAERLDLVQDNRFAVLTLPSATRGSGFVPRVRVGSRRHTAGLLDLHEVKDPLIRRFLETPAGSNNGH